MCHFLYKHLDLFLIGKTQIRLLVDSSMTYLDEKLVDRYEDVLNSLENETDNAVLAAKLYSLCKVYNSTPKNEWHIWKTYEDRYETLSLKRDPAIFNTDHAGTLKVGQKFSISELEPIR